MSLQSFYAFSKKNTKTNRLFLTVKFTLNLGKHGKNKNIHLQKYDSVS